MNERNLVLNNMLWRFLEQCGSQGVSFIVSIVLARLLSPGDYGTVALITVIISLLNIFINSGMGTALIQKKDADDLDFSTLFYFNIFMCVVLYILLFLLSPAIADYYNKPELTALTRVSGLTLIVSGVKGIQQSFVSRHMMFKRFFFATLGGTLGAAVIGITMTYAGYGPWALVIQALFNHVVDTIILWVTVKWRPRFIFSLQRLKGLFTYGSRLLISYLADKIYANVRTLIIGKIYSSSNLGYYNKGEHYPNLIISIVESALDSVLLPTMANYQDHVDSVRGVTRRSIKVSTFIIMPMMAGFAACAEPLTRIVLTEKWVPCVFYMRIFCVSYAFNTINSTNLNAIKAMGYSGIFLKLNLVKKVVGIFTILVTMFISVKAMAVGSLLTSVFEVMINAWPNRKLLGYGYKEQLQDIFPQIILSLLMSLCVVLVELLGFNDLPTVIIQIPLGVGVYLLGARLMRIDSFSYIQDIVIDYLKK